MTLVTSAELLFVPLTSGSVTSHVNTARKIFVTWDRVDRSN